MTTFQTPRIVFMAMLLLLSISLFSSAQPLRADAAQLQYAKDLANRGDVPALKTLLASGFDVNTNLDADGNTLLLGTTYWGRVEATQFLLAQGADVNHAHKTGYTALLNVIAFGHPDMVMLLLNAGAKVNVASAAGDTPLSLALSKGLTDVVQQLNAAISVQQNQQTSAATTTNAATAAASPVKSVNTGQVMQELMGVLQQKFTAITEGLDGNYTALDGPNDTGLTVDQASTQPQQDALNKNITDQTAAWSAKIDIIAAELIELAGDSSDSLKKERDILSLLNKANDKEQSAEQAYVQAISDKAGISQSLQAAGQTPNNQTLANANVIGGIFGMVHHSDHRRTAHHNHEDAAKLTKQAVNALSAYQDAVIGGALTAQVSGTPNAALQSAATNGSIPLALAAIAAGADVNTRDSSGKTSLMLAAAAGHSLTVQSLLGQGANASLLDSAGQTAAQLTSDPALQQALQSQGGAVPQSAGAQSAAPFIGVTGAVVYGGKEIGYYYKGQYAAVVQKLLDSAPAWRTPQSNTPDGIAGCQFPTFTDLATLGQRDQYIAAAVQEAFAMETYARLGTPSKSDLDAPSMMANLKSAHDLCSNVRGSVPGGSSATLYITCGWLDSLTYP